MIFWGVAHATPTNHIVLPLETSVYLGLEWYLEILNENRA